MTDWGTRYSLTNLRKLGRNASYWNEPEEYVLLTPEMAVRIEDYESKPPWVRSEIRAAAVGLSADRLVLAGKSAARLHGIKLLKPYDPEVELLCVDGVKPRGRSQWVRGTRLRSVYLPADQVVHDGGLRMTRIFRTLRDIAAWHGVLEGVVAMDSALSTWSEVTVEKLREELLAGPRYAGKDRVRRAVTLAVSNSGSPLESHARYLLLTADLPQVESMELQAEVIDPATGQTYFVDFLINGWLALEIDGTVKYDGTTYGSTDEVIRREREREKAIQKAGKVMRRTSDPQEVVELVRRTLEEAELRAS